ncbi:ParB/RepB/Spo0J family partition protein, partial [Candidatus Pacearchaeota archaeon]|nr:ParB/RepB/Spo0J family partition protein [Candidatus Pacearchaeota archaeon]
MSERIRNWENLSLHPMCSLFPEMNEDQYEMLVLDIKENGLHESIVLIEVLSEDDGALEILDGQNRRLACIDAGVEPTFEYYTGGEPLKYVISKNVGRRHLTTGQLAALAAGITNVEVGDNQFSSKSEEEITIEKAASLFGTSPKSVQRFKAIHETDPEIAMRVARGEETLNTAYTLMRSSHRGGGPESTSGVQESTSPDASASTPGTYPDLGTDPRTPP